MASLADRVATALLDSNFSRATCISAYTTTLP